MPRVPDDLLYQPPSYSAAPAARRNHQVGDRCNTILASIEVTEPDNLMPDRDHNLVAFNGPR
jgi:hypothetical protein